MEHYQIAQYLTVAALLIAPILCLWLPDGNEELREQAKRDEDRLSSTTLTGSTL